MNRTFRAFVQPVIPLCALALVAGCDSKDGSPTSGGGGPVNNEIDSQTAQQQSLQVVSLATDVTGGVDELANGDLSTFAADLGLSSAGTFLATHAGALAPDAQAALVARFAETAPGQRSSEEFVWNSAAGAWILDFSETQSDASGSATVDIYVSVQFLDGTNQPQMDPNENTASIGMDMDMGIDLFAQEDGQTLDMDMDFAMGMDVAGLPDGPFLVDSDGSMSGRLQWTGFGEDDLDAQFAMTWDMSVLVPADGTCATGDMTVTLAPYRLDATYDGDPTFSWELYENGALIDSGTESAACQVAAAAN